ncbi:MAG: hypothetical protein R6V77_02805 [Candidatus Cloacimonadaceae bacterium]
MKFFKTLFVLGGTALAGYFGLKTYKVISNITKLHKSLPEFLNNVYGEKPALHINHNLKTATIKVGFTQAILDKHTDIETTVREYIDDFYPELTKGVINIEVFVKSEMTEEAEDTAEEEETEKEV